MKILLFSLFATLLFLGPATWNSARAQEPPDMAAQYSDTLFTPEELDELLAPIALYPDPLLAQILPAATFIDQIDEAARYVRQYGRSARIGDQYWDVSVKAVAHYPDVLFMMDRKYDWTTSLGQAFINQPQDVMDTIQHLRAVAGAMGNLATTPQQQVIYDGELIQIVPAEPELIYVPQYDPLVIYAERPYPSYGFITFSTGFTIGAWLNRDFDWHRHRVYYHGWRGNGWISRSRPHIHDRRQIYINNRYSTINLNPRVVQHDTTRFRNDIRRDAQIRRERTGQPLPRQLQERGTIKTTPGRPVPQAPQPAQPAPRSIPQTPRSIPQTPRSIPQTPRSIPQTPRSSPQLQAPLPANPARQPALTAPQQAAPAPRPAIVEPRQPQLPSNSNLYRGRETRGAQPAPSSGYGGYGSSKDAATYRTRGQSSRENMRQNQQQPVGVERSAPVSRPKSPEPAQRQESSGARQSAPKPAKPQATKSGTSQERGEKEQRQQH